MNRFIVLITAVLVALVLAAGCSGGGDSTITPGMDPLVSAESSTGNGTRTHLWGYWDIYIDPDNMTAEIVADRSVMFTANVTKPLNKKVDGIQISFNGLTNYGTYIDADLDLSVTHPFPGNPGINGYDVRGLFMGDGSAVMDFNSDLTYPVDGVDQIMIPDEGDTFGGPDGYTRWFNYPEFTLGGPALFSYTPGNFASPSFEGTATLCGYKYFADHLGATDDLWDWLILNSSANGVFSSGATNTRNYYIRFPLSKGLIYGYAIIANWEGVEPMYHPSNADEAISVDIADNSDVWYLDSMDFGGDLNLDISVFDWNEHTASTVMDDYTIWIESNVLTDAYMLDATEMEPTVVDDHAYTFHVEIPVDTVTDLEGNEYWVIVETADYDYTNPFGAPNLADTDNLTGFFRFPLTVSGEAPCTVPEVLAIDPAVVPHGATLDDVVISCAMVEDGACLMASLLLDGSPEILGVDVTFIDENTITADFDLTDAMPGVYDVLVVNGCCSDPGIGEDLFEILEPLPSIHPISTGPVPIDNPYPDDKQFCVVGDDSYGHQGVFYFGNDYDVMYYPLDYSGPGELYMTMDGNYSIDPADFFGPPEDLGAIEVDPTGAMMITSHGTGFIWSTNQQNACSIWFEPEEPIVSTALTVNSDSFATVRTRDCEASFDAVGILWTLFGTETIIDPSVKITMNGVGSPYDKDSYDVGWSVDWAPIDTVGSVDGQVSDLEAYKLAVDSDPQGLTGDLDNIFYYLEGSPDDDGIEVFANEIASLGTERTLLATIDDVFVGTPIDIAVVNSAGNLTDILENWLCVLEDNGTSTWQVAVFNQNGDLIERMEPALAGDPLGIDCDIVNQELHVWVDDGGTLTYHILGF